jgi:hypothetical protein
VRRLWCRWFGHRRWIVVDPSRPDDITLGCTRCLDPATFRTLVRVEDDPDRPGWVRAYGLERLAGFLEGQI